MRDERPEDFVLHLIQPAQLASFRDERDESLRAARQRVARIAPARAVTGPVLRPPDRSAHTRGAEIVRGQDRFREYADRSVERVEHVVQGHDSPIRHMPAKQLEVLPGAVIGMVAVDPEKADRPVPSGRQVARKRAMDFNSLLQAGLAQRVEEIIPR